MGQTSPQDRETITYWQIMVFSEATRAANSALNISQRVAAPLRLLGSNKLQPARLLAYSLSPDMR
jgi:hypothetical protein